MSRRPRPLLSRWNSYIRARAPFPRSASTSGCARVPRLLYSATFELRLLYIVYKNAVATRARATFYTRWVTWAQGGPGWWTAHVHSIISFRRREGGRGIREIVSLSDSRKCAGLMYDGKFLVSFRNCARVKMRKLLETRRRDCARYMFERLQWIFLRFNIFTLSLLLVSLGLSRHLPTTDVFFHLILIYLHWVNKK